MGNASRNNSASGAAPSGALLPFPELPGETSCRRNPAGSLSPEDPGAYGLHVLE